MIFPVKKPRRKAKRKPSRPARTPVRKKNDARRKREFERAYGSQERVEWVKRQPCIVRHPTPCYMTLSENAHVVTAGLGRKADAQCIVPLCADHHRIFHQKGARWFSEHYHIDLPIYAALTDAAWLRYVSAGAGAAPNTEES